MEFPSCLSSQLLRALQGHPEPVPVCGSRACNSCLAGISVALKETPVVLLLERFRPGQAGEVRGHFWGCSLRKHPRASSSYCSLHTLPDSVLCTLVKT